jgi:DNA end-binding protein Ku
MLRSISSAILSFGLVSIPVKLYTAASAEGVKFSMITPAGNRVKQKYIDAVTGEEIAQGDCNKGYEYAKDQFVVFSKDEIKALEAEKSPSMEIREFIPASAFDALMVENSYYLGADKGGDKGYMLLAQTMKKTGKVAVARYNSRGKEHLIIVRPFQDGLVMHQMFYADEVRDFSEVTEKVAKMAFHDVEVEMAIKLVESLSTDAYEPEKYNDGYVARVKVAVDQKLSGETVTVAAPSEKSNVVDLMAALRASLDAAAAKKG